MRGERPTDDEVAAHEASCADSADPLAWLSTGASALAEAVTGAPEDLEALVFLNDAPPARGFWARRQCHETTMWIDPELAGDGIDELLGGFLTRPRSRLRCDTEAVLVVRPVDLPDWELTGRAVELYLRLWNRTDPPQEWRQLTAVTWA